MMLWLFNANKQWFWLLKGEILCFFQPSHLEVMFDVAESTDENDVVKQYHLLSTVGLFF